MIDAGIGANSASGGYDIDNSCKFEADNSEYLYRTPSSAGNRKTWTFSAWVKRSEITATSNSTGNQNMVFSSGDTYLQFDGNQIWINHRSGGSGNLFLGTNRLFRDASAWYHIVWQLDTTDSTAADRAKLWVNGVRETSFVNSTYTNMSQNYMAGINNTVEHEVGKYSLHDTTYAGMFNGYMAEIHLVDGTALTPASFGEFDVNSGIWKAKKYTGAYGTNGFYLEFNTLGHAESSHRYWRYEAYSTTNHTPRVSRIYLIKSDGTEQNFKYYVADNCSDSGSITAVASGSTSYSNDANSSFDIDLGSGNADAVRGFGLYSTYGGASRNVTARLYYSDDGSSWTLDTTKTIDTRSADACGEYNIYRGAGLGTDSSGNGNNWALNNLSAADQATDTPTNNFATWQTDINYNPTVSADFSFSEGGTSPKRNSGDVHLYCVSTMAMASGKWYMEYKVRSSGDSVYFGGTPITKFASENYNGYYLGQDGGGSIGYGASAFLYYWTGANTQYTENRATGDIIGVALDKDNNKIAFSKNGTFMQGSNGVRTDPATPSTMHEVQAPPYFWAFGAYSGNVEYQTNMGGFTDMSISSPASDENGYGTFEYAPPTGYYALCTKNLAEYG